MCFARDYEGDKDFRDVGYYGYELLLHEIISFYFDEERDASKRLRAL